MSRRSVSLLIVAVPAVLLACPVARAHEYDVVLRGGTVYDRSGRPPVVANLAVRGETIAAGGDLGGAEGRRPRGYHPLHHSHWAHRAYRAHRARGQDRR